MYLKAAHHQTDVNQSLAVAVKLLHDGGKHVWCSTQETVEG